MWGVTFLVAMALLVLFVPGNEPDRLGFVQSSFLGIVSWQFILVASTPVTGYNTVLDNFMLVSMSVVFAVYFWNACRIGFFEWLEGKGLNLFRARPAPSEAQKMTLRQPPSADEEGDKWAAPAAEVQVEKKRRAWPYRLFCTKCGEESIHWIADTTVGVTLSIVFAVVCAALLNSNK